MSDGVDQPPVVASATGAVTFLCQIVPDETLEVGELSIGYENGGAGSIFFMADVQQLDARTLPRQTLEGELDFGKALELDLKAQTFFHPRGLLGLPRGFRLRLKFSDLALQRRAVSCPVPFRGFRPASSAL